MSEHAAADPAVALAAAAEPAAANGGAPSPRARRFAIAVALLLAAAGVVVAITLGGSGSPTPEELAQRRAHLAFVAQGLRAVEPGVRRELRSARKAWPALAKGLPAHPSTSLTAEVAAALAAVEATRSPAFVPLIEELVGPASGIAMLFRSSQLLLRAGWQHVNAAITTLQHSSSASASSTVDLYIESIYQGVFDLSVIGERVSSTYTSLGGASVFRKRLTKARVNSIAGVYSPADRLRPHDWHALATH